MDVKHKTFINFGWRVGKGIVEVCEILEHLRNAAGDCSWMEEETL
jgi:hypothetical protein